MNTTPFLPQQDRESYQEFDYQRRLRLARIITLVSFIAILVFSPAITFYLLFHLQPLDSFLVALDIAGWFIIGCATLGMVAIRRGHINLATVCLCVGTLLGIDVTLVYASTTTSINVIALMALFASGVVIVIAGTLGTTPVLLGITLIAVLGGSVVLVFNAHTPLLEQNILFVLLIFVVIFVVLGVLMAVFQRGYQRALRELGDVRIAYERARELDELKNQFIINVNHELRNPVMAMMGRLDILDMSLATAPPERLQALTQGAIRASENLRALLASILDANRMEHGAGDFTAEAIPLAKAVESATQLISPQEGNLQSRSLEVFIIPDGLTVWGEPIRLQQILTNLISNAAKYSPTDMPIEVAAQVVRERASVPLWQRRSKPVTNRTWVEITVRDWGLGIPPKQIPLLFQRFVRLPRDLASTVIGNGLGLYLCRICAEAMGGIIWVESSGIEGEGSTFHVRLPQRPEEQ